jgi:hypothetical protein
VIAGGGSLALGLAAKLLDRDVPPKVHSELHQMTVSPFGPKDGASPYPNVKLVKGSEHRVLQVHTRRPTISLYLAATTHGGYCHVTQGGGAGGGGCNDGHSGDGRSGIDLWTTPGGAASRLGRYVVLIGHVHAKVAVACSTPCRIPSRSTEWCASRCRWPRASGCSRPGPCRTAVAR